MFSVFSKFLGNKRHLFVTLHHQTKQNGTHRAIPRLSTSLIAHSWDWTLRHCQAMPHRSICFLSGFHTARFSTDFQSYTHNTTKTNFDWLNFQKSAFLFWISVSPDVPFVFQEQGEALFFCILCTPPVRLPVQSAWLPFVIGGQSFSDCRADRNWRHCAKCCRSHQRWQ